MGYKGGWAQGMFMMGCSPGGGSSNMYSKLLNGDMSLSITMTTISTFASLGKLIRKLENLFYNFSRSFIGITLKICEC